MQFRTIVLVALIPISSLVAGWKVHYTWKEACFNRGVIEHDGNVCRFCDGVITPFGGK